MPDDEDLRRPGVRRAVAGGDTLPMRVYFAAPLFSAAERDWNATLTAALRGAGHEVFLAQEQEPAGDAAGIFAKDVGGIDWADALIAIVDGADPDSGTSWEIGYAYQKKPIVLVRTDMRRTGSGGWAYNPMLAESATIRVDAVTAPIDQVARDVLNALATLEPK
jgi:nucleoside 2-deoxyribosyltransferase